MKPFVTITALLAFSLSALGKSSVWKAEKGSSVTYLGGTCHLLRASDFPPPSEYAEAYRQSDTLVFETDISALESVATKQKIISHMLYQDGSTLDQHLSSDTWSLLSSYCTKKGLPMDAVKSFKPAMVMMTLTTLELQQLDVTTQGVDAIFSQRATADKKSIHALETIDQQIGFITKMGQGNADNFVSQMLKEIDQTKQEFLKMLDAWKTGDENALFELMVAMKAEDPQLHRELLLDRNATWLPLIDGYGATPETEFVLVGAAHLVGPNGILESLKKLNYTVTQL